MSDHRDLMAWREAMSLVESVYRELSVRLGFMQSGATAIRQTDRVGKRVNALRRSLTHADV